MQAFSDDDDHDDDDDGVLTSLLSVDNTQPGFIGVVHSRAITAHIYELLFLNIARGFGENPNRPDSVKRGDLLCLARRPFRSPYSHS